MIKIIGLNQQLRLLPKRSDFGGCKVAVVAGVGEGLMLVYGLSTTILLPESDSSCCCPLDRTGVTVQAEHYLTLSCAATVWNIQNII